MTNLANRFGPIYLVAQGIGGICGGSGCSALSEFGRGLYQTVGKQHAPS